MRNALTLAQRVGLGIVAMLLMLGASGLGALSTLAALQRSLASVVQDTGPKQALANENIVAVYENARSFAALLSVPSGDGAELASLDAARTAMAALSKGISERTAILEKSAHDAEEIAALEAVKAARVRYLASRQQVLTLIKAGQRSAGEALMRSETAPLQSAYIGAWKQFIAFEDRARRHAVEVSDAQYASGRSILAIALVTIFIIGAASGWSLVRTLQRAIGADPDYARRVVERIAAGDLAGPVQLQRGDRRSLLSSMAQMRTMLQQMIGRINHGTGSILQASGELVQVGATLSARSAAHAGTLEQTAGSMKELADAVRRNATSAHQADVLAQQASAVAGEGRMQVAALVQRMDALGVASGKIGDIVSLIDGIAFQTNILALNASVEAARAGTLGRGFAVVAGEVRTLAQRAADAAQQIKRLIETSTSEVAASAKLADAAGQTMLRVVSSITQVSTMVGDISSASVEQAIGIEQVNASVATMDATTHHNASMAEQVATAAATMQNLAGALAEIVDHFLLPPATGSGQRGADGA